MTRGFVPAGDPTGGPDAASYDDGRDGVLAVRPRPSDSRSVRHRSPGVPSPGRVPSAGGLSPGRAPSRGAPSPGRAVAGAAVSVSGVVLGIATLLWATDAPAPRDLLTDARAQQQAAPVAPHVDGSAGEAAEAGTGAAVPGAAESGAAGPGAAGGGAAQPGPAGPPAPARAPVGPLRAPARSAAPPVPSYVVPVTVLNNSRRAGLAARAAARFAAAGWPVAATGNFRGRVPVTTVYYDPGLEASARAVAADVDGVVRVRPRFPGLPARGLVVVVTREFAV